MSRISDPILQAMIFSSLRKEPDERIRTDAGIVFLATPHHGSSAADIALVASKLGNTTKLGSVASAASKELREYSNTVMEIHSDFAKLPVSLKIVTFFEKKGHQVGSVRTYT